MTSKIRVLSDISINKIAAGEVIENPASVVKELVENSLDAGATEVCIEIKGGGRQLIRITDNGSGMSPDDALLCFERHATSKISDVEDIHQITSMGFRGEAIPSIASISKFMLLTCPHFPKKEEMGTIVLVEGGKILKCAPAACSPGTTIEVKSLFFNVPVRKKFQKSPTHDTAEILKMLTLIALGHPSIKFQLISNQETLLHTQEENLGERIKSTLGADFSQSLCYLSNSKGELSIEGYIGMPACTRHNRTGQYLFINKRAVTSPLISYSVREGYGPSLSSNRHPLFVLHLTIPPSLVDVNVHPQKKEVRLRHEYDIKDLIIKGVESALQKEGIEVFEEIPPFAFSPPAFIPSELPPSLPKYPAFSFDPVPSIKPPPTPVLFEEPPKNRLLPPKVLTTLPGYFLIEPRTLPTFAPDGLCLVDQRKAHFRVIFEKLEEQETKLQLQSFLIPHTFEATPLEAALLKEHLLALNSLGIGIKEFGPNTYAIDYFPTIFEKADPQQFIYDLLQKLQDIPGANLLQSEQKKVIAQVASRASTAKNKTLTLEEAQGMMNQLMQCQNPYLCPYGKATIFQIKLEELVKFQQKGVG